MKKSIKNSIKKLFKKEEKNEALEILDKEAEELRTRAYDLITEYLDVEELELEEIAEELAEIKKRYLDNWSEASELM